MTPMDRGQCTIALLWRAFDGAIPGAVADLSQGDSVDENGDTPWVGQTRDYLDDPANADINVVMWSWCSINDHDAQRYVDNMEKLVGEYPNVAFVFMTGHAEGQGEDIAPNSVHYNNQLIRQHVASHGRVLFDFADIEAYDPDGDYFWDQDMNDALSTTSGNWAQQWIAQNPSHELSLLTIVPYPAKLAVDAWLGALQRPLWVALTFTSHIRQDENVKRDTGPTARARGTKTCVENNYVERRECDREKT